MNTYKIYPRAKVSLFKKTYQTLEKVLGLKNGKEFIDVDGSGVKSYQYHGKDLFVILDVDYDAIIIRTELDISSVIDSLGFVNKKEKVPV